MSQQFIDSFLPEFNHEMTGTRAVLECLKDELLDWKAHESLHTIGWVGAHLADTLSWVEVTLTETSFDVAPVGGEPHQTPELGSATEILEVFDQNLEAARKSLAKATDESMTVPWTLLQGGEELFTQPRGALVKNLFINHMVHHRAFLISYLRMNGIECPNLYG